MDTLVPLEVACVSLGALILVFVPLKTLKYVRKMSRRLFTRARPAKHTFKLFLDVITPPESGEPTSLDGDDDEEYEVEVEPVQYDDVDDLDDRDDETCGLTILPEEEVLKEEPIHPSFWVL